jgi:hypothetical protein
VFIGISEQFIHISMFTNWTDVLTAAIQTLPPLHHDILVRTMELPGKRKKLQYTEASRIWNLDPDEFNRQRDAAFEAVRLYLVRHGVTCPGDLVLR